MADTFDLVARAVAFPVSGFLLLNGLDDLFLDYIYYTRGLWRSSERRITEAQLRAIPQQRIAIIVPAWHEAEVIQHMLELNLGKLDYDTKNYDIFVGTYPNDPETQERVDAVARKARNIHKVVTPHDGPTNKADNLNWVYQGLKLVEERRRRRFDILLMHDAEDIIHPLSLLLYNAVIPANDFVQTPVFPLETNPRKLVAGTYVDEFAEYHMKDMLVRARIGGLVPSAGVGSAFSRDSFEEIALAHSERPFNPESVTEDYEIGMKFRLAGKRTAFLTRSVPRIAEVEKGLLFKRKVRMEVDDYVATREYFPDTFRASVRQRSRWVLGIAMQAWSQLGWQGPPAVRYCLWRDRKAVFTSYAGPVAYLLAIYCVVRLLLGLVTDEYWTLEYVFVPGSLLWYLVMANTVLLLWRTLMKFNAVEAIYGPLVASFAVPRFVVSNVISLFATSRALVQYAEHRITGKPIRWVKTSHQFPNVEALRSQAVHRRIGELLVDERSLAAEDLVEALRVHEATGVRLGEVCVRMGFVTPAVLAEALGRQLDLPVVEPDPARIPAALLLRLPEADAARMGVLPVEERGGEVVVAVSAPPEPDVHARLGEAFGGPVSFALCLEGALEHARARAYRALEMPPSASPPPVTSRPLEPDDVDLEALREVGWDLWRQHGAVPFPVPGEANAVEVVCAAPLAPSVAARVGEALGVDVRATLAPPLSVRVVLAAACARAWPDGIPSAPSTSHRSTGPA